jgi:hypothetical protein
VLRVVVESVVALASACEDAEGLVQEIILLEGELMKACQAREVAKENSHGLSDAAVDAEWWQEESNDQL